MFKQYTKEWDQTKKERQMGIKVEKGVDDGSVSCRSGEEFMKMKINEKNYERLVEKLKKF